MPWSDLACKALIASPEGKGHRSSFSDWEIRVMRAANSEISEFVMAKIDESDTVKRRIFSRCLWIIEESGVFFGAKGTANGPDIPYCRESD